MNAKFSVSRFPFPEPQRDCASAGKVLRTALRQARRPGFTLVEVLLAVMILGIGMIMIASVYPVGATWTRQNAEESIAGIIARNAVSIIQSKYTSTDVANVSYMNVVDLPNLVAKLPTAERTYNFGAEPPYPAVVPANALYFWTAMIRKRGPLATSGDSYDLYVLVFKKGSVSQTFAGTPLENPTPNPSRDKPNELYVPYVALAFINPIASPSNANLYNSFTIQNLTPLTGAMPQGLIGSQIVEKSSGNIFRVISGTPSAPSTPTNFTINGSLQPNGAKAIYFVPPPDNEAGSPLIYIYQTTVSF